MPGFAATDLFSVGAEASPQTSTTSETRERSLTLAADGDKACESSAYNVTTEYTADYQSCSTGSIVATLGTFLSTFGAVQDSKIITGIEITLSNKAYPSFSITGHNHASNPHTSGERDFDASVSIPAQIGTGITMPMLATTKQISIAATSDVTGATFSIALEHMDTEGADGNHFDGQNRTCRVEASLTGIGVEGDVTWAADWIVDDNSDTDSNQESDTFTTSAHMYIDAN